MIANHVLTDVIGWDIKNWSRALPLWEEVIGGSGSGKLALEIGAKHGGLSLYLALRGFHVICSDQASPRDLALSLHQRYQLTGTVEYAAQDATKLDYPDNTLDAVILKSVLGSVGHHGRADLRQRAVEEIHRVLKPGGAFLFAETLAATKAHRWLRNRFTKWGSYYGYMPLDEMREYLWRFSRSRFETFGFIATFGRSERQRSMLHYADRLLNPLLPTKAKYIIFGYAIK